jgi:rubrerythrin
MDFFDLAKNMEKESRKMYETFSADAPLKELKSVFSFLAVEEQGHWELFASMQKKSAVAAPVDDNILDRAKHMLAGWAHAFSVPGTIADFESAYVKALLKEKEAVAFYEKEKENLKSFDHKKVLDIIIEQEQRHKRLMEELVDFVRRPKQWVENAEFNHLDEY